MKANPKRGERRRLRVRKERLRQLGRRKFKVTTDGALAAALGIDPKNFSWLINGRMQPSATTITHLLDSLDVEFEDLFERYTPEPAASPPTNPEAATTAA